MAKVKRTPTREQQDILDDARARPRDGRKVVAFAGTGKTSTLEMLADERRDPGAYVAFNRAIKQEAARRFPRHIKVTTAHAAAYAALRMHEQQDRLNKRLYGDGVAQLVRLPRCRLPPDALGQVVLDTLARYCNSADREVGLDHVALDPAEPEDLRFAALAGAQALWERVSSARDDCPITHDTYLKLWQLGEPRLRGAEWVLFDEAQDASPVMIDVMVRQGLPITWVGDPHQQIYAFRGAVNAMRIMPGAEWPLTQSWRFGCLIADAANAVLGRKPEGLRPALPILGNPGRASQIGRVPRHARHAFLARTNSEWLDAGLASTCRVHVIGGLDETERLLLGAWGLWRYNQRPERCPAVARFATWSQLCEHTERFDDRELTFARGIVEQYRDGLPAAIANLRARHVEHEADADLILSTAHKAKGREFDHVRLGPGFVSPLDEEWATMTPAQQEAELNLLYVALTRAVVSLEPNRAVGDCLALARGLVQPGRPAPPLRLPELRIDPPVAARPAEPPTRHPPARAPDRVPAGEGAPRPEASSGPWTPAEDEEAQKMASQGFPPEDIADWLSRPLAAVVVRLAVLGAPGADAGLAAQVIAALTPPGIGQQGTAPPPPPPPPPPAAPRREPIPMPDLSGLPAKAQPDALGPADFLAEFPPLGGDPAGAASPPLPRDDWGMSDAERAAAAERLRAKLVVRRPFSRQATPS